MATSLRLYRMKRSLRRERVFRDRTNPLDTFDDYELYRRYRFPRKELLEVIDKFSGALEFRYRRKGSLPASIQIMIALRFYASGCFQEAIGDTFGVSKATVCSVIGRVSDVIAASLNEFVKFDYQEETDRTKQKFFAMASFPDVIGCIDCTHIKITAPTKYENDYMNRKGYHSINVQLVCDADLKILNAVIKMPGSTHDAIILRHCFLYEAFEEDPPPLKGHLLGHSGYMIRPWLLTPYVSPQSVTQQRYNSAHVVTCATMDRCKALLKRRWHCLHRELRYAPNKASVIIAACVALHNMALTLPAPESHCDHKCVHEDQEHRWGSGEEEGEGDEDGDHDPDDLVQAECFQLMRDHFAEAHFGR